MGISRRRPSEVPSGGHRICHESTGVWRALDWVYPVGVVKRTNINLDMDLVHQAAHELGTRRTTDTVHQALREVIARARRARLGERDFEDLTPDALEAMRRPAGRTA
jgi:Arc/MetJ family transcription regulator